MKQCPKCGGMHISGPHYSKQRDALVYRCACGYERDEPTEDQKQRERDEDRDGPPWL
jgi:hypothetical protein